MRSAVADVAAVPSTPKTKSCVTPTMTSRRVLTSSSRPRRVPSVTAASSPRVVQPVTPDADYFASLARGRPPDSLWPSKTPTFVLRNYPLPDDRSTPSPPPPSSIDFAEHDSSVSPPPPPLDDDFDDDSFVQKLRTDAAANPLARNLLDTSPPPPFLSTFTNEIDASRVSTLVRPRPIRPVAVTTAQIFT